MFFDKNIFNIIKAHPVSKSLENGLAHIIGYLYIFDLRRK